MDTINFKKHAILITLFALSSCILFEDPDERTYFDKEGTGYVYYWETKKPAPNVRVRVTSGFKGGWEGHLPINEDSYTDSAGFYRIRFLKRTAKQNVSQIKVYAYDDINKRFSEPFSCAVDELDKLLLQIDTLWIR